MQSVHRTTTNGDSGLYTMDTMAYLPHGGNALSCAQQGHYEILPNEIADTPSSWGMTSTTSSGAGSLELPGSFGTDSFYGIDGRAEGIYQNDLILNSQLDEMLALSGFNSEYFSHSPPSSSQQYSDDSVVPAGFHNSISISTSPQPLPAGTCLDLPIDSSADLTWSGESGSSWPCAPSKSAELSIPLPGVSEPTCEAQMTDDLMSYGFMHDGYSSQPDIILQPQRLQSRQKHHGRNRRLSQDILLRPTTSAPAYSNPIMSRRHSRGSSIVGRKSYPCTLKECSASFSRQADLDRHVEHIHTDDHKKKRFECDYEKCPRRKNPFHRKDHFRDHLRDQHKEDIIKRGSNANQAVRRKDSGRDDKDRPAVAAAGTDDVDELVQYRELKDCITDPAWWRCSRCLGRVHINQHVFVCPKCKSGIEKVRLMVRTPQNVVGTDGEGELWSADREQVKSEEEEESAYGIYDCVSD